MEPNLKESIRRILSIPKIKSSGLHIDDIATHVKNENSTLFTESESIETIKKKLNSFLLTDVKRKSGSEFSKVKNSKTGKFKKGFYKLSNSSKDSKPHVEPINTTKQKETELQVIEEPENLFIGKAGECAVISELLFRNYNANLMMVDDGVDVVASKNNVYYFIQVKTTTMKDNGKIYANIKTGKFDMFINTQIRYIIVARCKISGMETNLFFVFSNKDIEQFIFDKVLYINNNNISIKIKIEKDNNNRPVLYDNKERDVTFYMNNFKL